MAEGDRLQEAVADAAWNAMEVPAPDDPPTPEGPLRANVLVYIVELDQWQNIVVPHQTTDATYARRSVTLLKKCVLTHIGHSTTRAASSVMRIFRCEGLSASTKGYAIPPLLKGNALIADRSWYLASYDPTTYVEYSPRWEPQIEPHRYLDALGSINDADASQHDRDVGDSVDSPN